jgi:hypothetical protein
MAHCLRQRLALASLAALLLLLVAAPTFASEVLVYAQNPDFAGLIASQNDTSGTFGAYATSYDNFTLGTATAANAVEWIGGYFNPQTAGPITAWTVSFYSDNAGQPGGVLASFAIAGNGGETFLQNDALGDPNYLYSAAVNFNAAAGTTYWMSVVPDLAFPPQWGWGTSTQGDGISYQDFFGTRSPNATDLSFALFAQQNTGVPEPGSLLLLGTGIVGIAGMLRRKLND